MKSAKEYWTSKFDEYPQTDADRLAVVMMAEYYNYCKDNLTTNVSNEAACGNMKSRSSAKAQK